MLAGKTVTSLSVGYTHTCAVADSVAYCWGANNNGRIGDGTKGTNRTSPVAVNASGVLSGKQVTAVAAGVNHSCVIASNSVYCWGFGGGGRLGNNSTSDSNFPVAVLDSNNVFNGKTLTAIDAGEPHTCAIASGSAYCWGNNSNGQLGNNTTTQRLVPVAVSTGGVLNGKTATDISAGNEITCATASGAAYCWGYNQGRLGDGVTTADSSVPVAVNTSGALSGAEATKITTWQDHSCALATKMIHCWGNNGSGRLGDGSTTNRSTPVAANHSNIPDSVFPTVSFNNIPATSVTFVSSTQLTAVTPAHAAGAVDVKVTNPDSQVATLANSYTYIAPVVVPGAPTGLTTTPAEGGVTLSWTAPSNNGGAAITDYVIEYSSNGGSTWQTFAHTPSPATNTTVTGLTTGVTYTFRVSAVNSAGVGAPSNTATGQTTYITVSSSASVSLSVTPTTTSRTSSNSHNVLTSTNAPNGYSLSLSMVGTSRNLANGAQTVGATSGTLAAPSALGVNTWGFRVAGVGGFGAGGASETNVASSAYTWAGVPAQSSPTVIKTTSTPATNDATTVWYGMRADTSKPSGTYTNTVLYTAVTN